jgi:hypothetical protein
VVSITNPGLWLGDAAVTRRLARACNDFGARLVQDHPGRFGLFASMPMPDVDGTLEEIAYAYDVVKTDGVGLMTSYGDTRLKHASFRPVMEELNRRRAVVHVHPTAANCCRNLAYAPGVGPGSLSMEPTPPAQSWASSSAAMPRGIQISASSGPMPAARRHFSRRESTARRALLPIASPTASCRS